MENPNQVFYECDTAKIYYDEHLDTLFLEYTGRVKNHQQFVEINTEVLEAFLKLKTRKFIADIRRMGIIAIESQKWVADVLLPGMIKHLKGKELYHAQYLDEKDIMVKISGKGVKSRSEEQMEGFVLEQFADWNQLEEKLRSINLEP